MENLDKFIIPLSGTKKDTSNYSFKLKKDFFEFFEDTEILDSDIKVEITLKNSFGVFEMNFELAGNLTVICDRCLDPMVQTIENEAELIIKYGDKYEEVDDKVVTIAPTDEQINIASFIYEYAKLALPIQRIHPEGECNKQMLEQMHKYERKEEEKETDSRWNALSALKNKLE